MKPGYQRFDAKLTALKTKSAAFTATPATTALTELRQAWAAAYTEWHRGELFEFGPAEWVTFAQYKRADGWRPNSHFDSKTFYADVRYQATENVKFGVQYTHMDHLAQQPGELSDRQFVQDARQSNRERNWFAVSWNLFNINADWKVAPRSNINLLAFGLVATRQSLGFRPDSWWAPAFTAASTTASRAGHYPVGRAGVFANGASEDSTEIAVKKGLVLT